MSRVRYPAFSLRQSRAKLGRAIRRIPTSWFRDGVALSPECNRHIEALDEIGDRVRRPYPDRKEMNLYASADVVKVRHLQGRARCAVRRSLSCK